METVKKSSRLQQWLAKNGYSEKRLPDQFIREVLFSKIRIGSTVGIVTTHGSLLTGRATIPNQQQRCWVLNGGGRHGTPLIANAENVIYVAGAVI